MVVQVYQDLNVYQKAFKVALEVYQKSHSFPKSEQYAMTDQMRRASKSICANIAEGFAKQRNSTKDFQRYLVIAMGSANEMAVWTDFCHALGYVSEEVAVLWRNEYEAIAKMLNKLHGSFNV